jgi:hypothetical protein
MSSRDQENAYFYEINKELINRLREQLKSRSTALFHGQLEPRLQIVMRKTFYDYLDAALQPDEHWISDLLT